MLLLALGRQQPPFFQLHSKPEQKGAMQGLGIRLVGGALEEGRWSGTLC